MNKIFSHENKTLLSQEISYLEEKIQKNFSGEYAKECLSLLEKLTEFEFGRFLILNKGLNGKWTDYAVYRYPHFMKETSKPTNEVEDFILNASPVILATQNRFNIFKEKLQKEVASHKTFASLPCGVMSDLLELDFSSADNFKLMGIDLDKESIDLAQDLCKKKGLIEKTSFLCQDAWSLDLENEFDVLTSNGLNLYIKDDKRVQQLYEIFFKLLKKDGVLITSFLTPSLSADNCEWKMEHIEREGLDMQKKIFTDVLGVMWDSRPTSTLEMIKALEKAGFKEIEIFPDKGNCFPTVRAIKK